MCRQNRARARRGFTLIELMIVVAIVSIIGALAMPRFIDIRYRAQRAEVPSILDSVYTAQVSYYVANDTYVSVPTFTPRATPNRQQAAWPTTSNFYLLDWRPDGPVRGIYQINTPDADSFEIVGESDVDENSTNARFVATQSVTVTRMTPVTVF